MKLSKIAVLFSAAVHLINDITNSLLGKERSRTEEDLRLARRWIVVLSSLVVLLLLTTVFLFFNQ